MVYLDPGRGSSKTCDQCGNDEEPLTVVNGQLLCPEHADAEIDLMYPTYD